MEVNTRIPAFLAILFALATSNLHASKVTELKLSQPRPDQVRLVLTFDDGAPPGPAGLEKISDARYRLTLKQAQNGLPGAPAVPAGLTLLTRFEISAAADHLVLDFGFTSPVEGKTSALTHPARLVVDFVEKPAPASKGPALNAVRAVPLGGGERIILEFSAMPEFSYSWNAKDGAFELRIAGAGAAHAPVPSGLQSRLTVSVANGDLLLRLKVTDADSVSVRPVTSQNKILIDTGSEGVPVLAGPPPGGPPTLPPEAEPPAPAGNPPASAGRAEHGPAPPVSPPLTAPPPPSAPAPATPLAPANPPSPPASAPGPPSPPAAPPPAPVTPPPAPPAPPESPPPTIPTPPPAPAPVTPLAPANPPSPPASAPGPPSTPAMPTAPANPPSPPPPPAPPSTPASTPPAPPLPPPPPPAPPPPGPGLSPPPTAPTLPPATPSQPKAPLPKPATLPAPARPTSPAGSGTKATPGVSAGAPGPPAAPRAAPKPVPVPPPAVPPKPVPKAEKIPVPRNPSQPVKPAAPPPPPPPAGSGTGNPPAPVTTAAPAAPPAPKPPRPVSGPPAQPPGGEVPPAAIGPPAPPAHAAPTGAAPAILYSSKDEFLDRIVWSVDDGKTRIVLSFKGHVNFMSRSFPDRVQLNYLDVFLDSKPVIDAPVPGLQKLEVTFPPSGLRVTVTPEPGYVARITPMLAGTIVAIEKSRSAAG